MIKKIDGCANNLGKLSTAKTEEYIPCRYSMSAIYRAFDDIENKHTLWHVEDCMKIFFVFLWGNRLQMQLILKRKEMLPLTKKS